MVASDTIAVTRTRLPTFLSDLVFNYIACARAYGMTEGGINEDEEELAITLLLGVFSDFGLTFTREDLLADVEART